MRLKTTTRTGAAVATSVFALGAGVLVQVSGTSAQAAEPDCVSAGSGLLDCTAPSENTDGTPNTDYTFRQPAKVPYGSNIVLRGMEGYLISDGSAGSVVNFFVDAEQSGDPNTVQTKRTVKHPVTGDLVADKRTHAMVQATSAGAWQATIPFPTNANAQTLTGAGVVKLWKPGTTHSVRMLTGTLIEGDHRRFASAHFTVVKAKPVLKAKLAKAKVKKSQRAKVKVTVKIPGAAKVKPKGQLVVLAGKKVVGKQKLKPKHNGKVAIKLKRLKKGKHKITVRLQASALHVKTVANAKKLTVR